MPGITGIIDKTPRGDGPQIVKAMVQRMLHEPFYSSGIYDHEGLGLHLGWTSLKGSFAAGLPIWNETKDIGLVFSGEDHRDTSEIFDLRARGHACELGNASYLVHLYEEEGIGFLGRLNGTFSGVLIDLRESRVVLFNDRFGLSRIYYHEDGDRLYFSSEAKAILAAVPATRSLDERGLGEFLACGCTLEDRTLFTGLSLVPGGSMWVLQPGQPLTRGTYFSRSAWEDQPPLEAPAYYVKFKELFPRILRRYFRPKERVGVSLTGGIDTRMIMAWADFPPLQVPCYTFGGMFRDCADVRIARRVARACQQLHTTIGVNRKFFSEFPALAKRAVYYSDGTMNTIGAVELFVNRIARDIAPIRLTGNYGDQVIRRAVGFKPLSLRGDAFSPDFQPALRAGIETLQRARQVPETSFFAFRQLPWHHYPRLALESTQIVMRSPFLDNDLLSLVYRCPEGCATSLDLSLGLIAEGDRVLGRIETDRGIRRPSVPILTPARHFFQEFTFRAEYAYDYGMPQWLVRLDHRLSCLHLERAFLGRHKFYHFRLWFREELAKYVQDILLDSRSLSRPYLLRDRVEAMVKAHVGGYGNYTNEIHMLLTCELIQRHLVERI